MARRTMTLRRIDPWSVLKFGFVVNLCGAVVFVLGFAIVWFVIGQLGIIEQACQLAEDVGFEDCGVDGGAVFRLVLLFAGLAAVIMTGIAVFGAFLHNLLAELIGGIELTLVEEGGATTVRRRSRSDATTGRAHSVSAGSAPSGDIGTPPPRGDERTQGRDEPTQATPPRQGSTATAPRSEEDRPESGSSGGATGGGSDDAVFGGRDQDQGWRP